MPLPVLSRSTYYDKHYRPSAALLRARKPYLVRNMVGAASLGALVIAIYSYTFYAIGQDDFSDVQMPPAPMQEPPTPQKGVFNEGGRGLN